MQAWLPHGNLQPPSSAGIDENIVSGKRGQPQIRDLLGLAVKIASHSGLAGQTWSTAVWERPFLQCKAQRTCRPIGLARCSFPSTEGDLSLWSRLQLSCYRPWTLRFLVGFVVANFSDEYLVSWSTKGQNICECKSWIELTDHGTPMATFKSQTLAIGTELRCTRRSWAVVSCTYGWEWSLGIRQ